MIINPSLGGGVGAGVDLSDYYTKEETNRLISNPNLLDNWYFADPIDQRGGYVVPPNTSVAYSDGSGNGVTTAYVKVDRFYNGYPVVTVDGKQATASADSAVRGYAGADWGKTYSIDRWHLSVAALDVSTHKLTASANYGRIVQILDGTSLVGKTVTFSVRVHSITGGNLMIFGGPGDYGMVTVPSDFDGVVSTTVEVVDPEKSYLSFSICLDTAGASAVIEAAKLELGSQQTLAHQDENGNWVLNDPPPDKALELAKCQSYQIELNSSKTYAPILGIAVKASGAWYLICPIPTTLRTNPYFTYTGQAILDTAEGTFHATLTFDRLGDGSAIFTVTPVAQPTSAACGIVYLVRPEGGIPSALLDANL